LVEPKKGTKWPSNLPRFENRQDAVAVCKDLCKSQFLVRSEKQGKGELGVSYLFFPMDVLWRYFERNAELIVSFFSPAFLAVTRPRL